MAIDWVELKKDLFPIPDYDDLSRRWNEAYAYAFVRRCFNFSMTGMAEYTRRLLGGDTKQRYNSWMEPIIRTFQRFAEAGIRDNLDLLDQVGTQERFEGFIALTGLEAREVISVLKYMAFWFIPMKKNLGSLVKNDPIVKEDIAKLRAFGIRSNLDLLEAGLTPEARQELAERSGVPVAGITSLVHRADFSRLPWTSTATISNYFGSGYGSLAKLANTDLEQVSDDFYRYGASIHKNFKFGSEIDNAHRVARLVPKVVEV
jgi:hypothetical protein